ncbi:PAS domain S-box-containing protein/diguanylate cyclase (GGDEF)-like protein [Halanaerobium saccharolyticum]|uniref:PAS domain S-box-containing protein/diguanylate cyclase (GGDEF)-like protein n=1 Tax=Halanaerobium saccharolyticum TaxID=43595 RepID=A0A4R6LII4_9FIRM|nr:HD domain-containing phosphohydrolase [Halanaerobium saccharolyticum]TDO78293.1 PAS domain S-box-containing protein/diguanylate cyclase (GGDEF)-like protein [Halanaerobium saccharolyticum]
MNLNSTVQVNELFKTLNEDKVNKILVLNKNEKDFSLIKNFLDRDFKVLKLEKETDLFKANYDLIILDAYYYKKFKKEIIKIKESEVPIFLPVILLSGADKQDIYLKEQENIFDDLFILPVKKQIMKYRIKNLLKIRKLSLKSEYRYYELAEKSPIGIFILNKDKIIYANPVFTKILNKNCKQIINQELMTFIHKKDKAKINNLLKKKGKKGTKNVEIRIIINKNQVKWLNLNFNQIKFNDKKSILVTAQNITEKKEKQSQIKFLNYHDKLTGLYNRNFLEKELKRLSTRRQLPISVIMGDVNGLKLVNDAFGHQKGNELLKAIAGIFETVCRKEDIIARWGGDEFVILLPKTSLDNARKVAERIRKSCAEADKMPINLSIALGVAQIKNLDQSYEEVFKKAEAKMYRNKISGSESASNSIILSLENTLLEKSHETKEHAARMNNLVVKFANKLNLSTSEIDNLKLLSKLHDIGKVSIPEKILKKPDKLTEEEYETVKDHPESGYRIVKSIPELASVAEGVLSHHERWDGSGYPQGLVGKKIPYTARIIALIDSFDVMTHQRSYKSAISKKEALSEIQRCAGSQFDPELAEKFIEMIQN